MSRRSPSSLPEGHACGVRSRRRLARESRGYLASPWRRARYSADQCQVPLAVIGKLEASQPQALTAKALVLHPQGSRGPSMRQGTLVRMKEDQDEHDDKGLPTLHGLVAR